jgi:hypothetical protein
LEKTPWLGVFTPALVVPGQPLQGRGYGVSEEVNLNFSSSPHPLPIGLGEFFNASGFLISRSKLRFSAVFTGRFAQTKRALQAATSWPALRAHTSGGTTAAGTSRKFGVGNEGNDRLAQMRKRQYNCF